MIDLTQTTILLPIYIEQVDRYNNAKIVLNYLNKHFNTNVIIYETSEDGKTKLDFTSDLKNLRITHHVQGLSGLFHRTKYLNKMLHEATTPVVVNHDIDILLKPETYVAAQNMILENKADVIYPYQYGESQVMVEKTLDRTSFLNVLDLDQIEPEHTRIYLSYYGHCIFFNKDVYWEGGAENENFISWGPEDKERAHRFVKLEYRVGWLDNTYIYHFEHDRLLNSTEQHEYGRHNHHLYAELVSKSKEELLNYYRNQEYLKQYDNILHTKQEQSTVPQDEHTVNS